MRLVNKHKLRDFLLETTTDLEKSHKKVPVWMTSLLDRATQNCCLIGKTTMPISNDDAEAIRKLGYMTYHW